MDEFDEESHGIVDDYNIAEDKGSPSPKKGEREVTNISNLKLVPTGHLVSDNEPQTALLVKEDTELGRLQACSPNKAELLYN